MNSAVLAGQSFLDKAIETTGSVENCFEMAILNGVSITEPVAVGTILNYDNVTNKKIVGLFGERNKPATGLTMADESLIPPTGIDYWAVEIDFIIE